MDRPIRVLRVFSRLNIGGPSVHVLLLAAGLQRRGYQTRLVVGHEAPSEGNCLDLAAAQDVRCEMLPGLGREIRLLSDFRALWGLYGLIRRFRPHILHTHTAKAGLLGRTAGKMARVPIIVHTYHGHVLHGYFGPLVSRLFRLLERLLARWSDVLIAVSAAVKQDLVRYHVASAERIRVIPLGLDLEPLAGPLPSARLRGPTGIPPEVPLVGVVGRLVPIKDISTFLRAAEFVAKSFNPVYFAIVGDGEERSLLEWETARLGLSDVVRFCGWSRDMKEVYGDLDLVVNSSLNEGTPVALIEALAAGRPVIATRVGGTPDLLGNGERGVLVPPGDPRALGDAILEALRSPDDARRRAAIGQRYVLAHHSTERLLDDMDTLYRELLVRAGVPTA